MYVLSRNSNYNTTCYYCDNTMHISYCFRSVCVSFFMIRPLISNNQPVKEHSKRHSNKDCDRNQTVQAVNHLASDQLPDMFLVNCFPLLIGHQLSFMLSHPLLPLSFFRIPQIFWLSLLSVSGASYPGVLQDPR